MEKDHKWRKVSEEEKETIRNESKNLLNEFASKLNKIKAKENHFENDSGTREEGTGWQTDEDFKNITLGNAPLIEDGFFVAEKGGWKK